MFKKILIANRGEIAVRIARTAREMGISTVAICSEADSNSLHSRACDESFVVGSASPSDSYLNAERIIAVALETGAQAVHPGYGFLSENADFAELCEMQGIKFVGPSSRAIRIMGLKSSAKKVVERANVPLLPGYHGDNQKDDTLLKEANRIGFPLLIKAIAGGGGKGMRVVEKPEEFTAAVESARREAVNSFDNGAVLLERYIEAPRHIEVQIFADQDGNCVHLYERDCSMQRRYQKVIEEAPAPALKESTRERLGAVAISAAQAVGYEGAGTVEFIMDEAGEFYFMEMNTRLQVEHPVTEMITKQDLVEWQIRVANGENLPFKQDGIKVSGHAIESRVYAENPSQDFFPSAGVIEYINIPRIVDNEIRMDSGVQLGDEVGVHYDPMIAKIICWGETRDLALRKMNAALKDYQLAGFKTNIDFLQKLTALPEFRDAEIKPQHLNTRLIERFKQHLTDVTRVGFLSALALFIATRIFPNKRTVDQTEYSPWATIDGWRLNSSRKRSIHVVYEGREIRVEVEVTDGGLTYAFEGDDYVLSSIAVGDNQIDLLLNERVVQGNYFDGEINSTIFHDGNTIVFDKPKVIREFDEDLGDSLVAPLPGYVRAVKVSKGDAVVKEQPLMIVEAMKMEHTILAPRSGIINEVFYVVGDKVSEGAELLSLENEKS